MVLVKESLQIEAFFVAVVDAFSYSPHQPACVTVARAVGLEGL